MPYISTNPPISDISIISVQGSYQHIWHNACFLFMMNGEIQVEMNGHATYLNGNAIMLVEPDTPYTVTGHGSNMVITIRMDYDFFSQGRAAQQCGSLVCNSAEDSERDYSLLRKMLSHLAINYFEASESNKLQQLELCYALLHYLDTTHYVADSSDLSKADATLRRDRMIISYIESNYMHEIQLEDLAEFTYLSIPYISRRFRKLTGTNFKAYLQEVRLRHAVSDMRTTRQTITDIAYNSGFPNVGALRAAIRGKYNMSSAEFRKHLAQEEHKPAEPEPYHEVEYENIRAGLQALTGDAPHSTAGIYRYPDQLEYRIENVGQFRPVKPIWKAMINVGTLKDVASVSIRSHLEMLQDEIGFHYARIESVLSDESIPMMPDGEYNFSYFDRAVDLLLSLDLKPFLDLSFRIEYIMLSSLNILFRAGGRKGNIPEKEFIKKVSALIRHCINTFGSEEVEKWGVELAALHDEELRFLETPSIFAQRFCAAYRMIKEWLPNLLVGGPEHNIAMNPDFMREVMELITGQGVTPDFLSLCAIPYEPIEAQNGGIRAVFSPNPNYLLDSVLDIRDVIREVTGDEVPIWITVFGPDIRTRNYMNDSCYQATFIAKNTIDLIGLVDVIGYWQLSDIGTEHTDTTRILFGGTGIISKHGLKKPGFTTLKRFASLNAMLVDKTGNLLMTTNGINTYSIVLYNYAHFTDLYCLSEGENITYDNVYTMFKDAATKDIRIRLGGLQKGRYKLITTTLNREHGSLFDEWLRYGVLDGLQPHDIRYLRDIVHPHRMVRYLACEDGTMDLTLQMLPHEIKFLRLIREL